LLELARKAMPAQDGGIDITYDSAGVTMLMDIIESEGGVNKMALDSSADSSEHAEVIPLSSDAHTIRQSAMAKSLLGGALGGGSGSLIFALAVQSDVGEPKIARALDLPSEALPFVYSALDLADERIKLLAELFEVGEALVEEKTSVLVNHDDDPNDSASPRRLASRQFVFHPDRKMTISPILNPSSVIIKVAPSVELLDEPIQGHVRFQTYGRRRAAANLKDRKRHDAFDFEVTGPGDTEGIKRIKLTTSVAKDEQDRVADVGMLIEQVRSRTNNFPTLVSDSFRPTIPADNLHGLIDKMVEIVPTVKKFRKDGAPVQLTLASQSLAIACHKKIVTVPAPSAQASGTADVHPDDFVAVTEALSRLPLKGAISVSMDEHMVAFRFATALASYEVYLPSVSDKLHRSNRHIVKMSPVTWPRIGEPLTNDELPDSELPSASAQASNDELPNV
jgi:hypothetical protein